MSHTITPTSNAVYFPTCQATFGLDRPFLTGALWHGSPGRSVVSEQAVRPLEEKAYFCVLREEQGPAHQPRYYYPQSIFCIEA